MAAVAKKREPVKMVRVTAPQPTLSKVRCLLEEAGVHVEELCGMEGCRITKSLRIPESALNAFHKVLEDL